MSLKELQTKIGVSPDGEFGPATAKAVMKYFNLSPERAAHFLGQCSHESGHFTIFSENLNYSKDGLLKIFKKYFSTPATAGLYARQPEKIANRVYASRMGNGNEASGHGWKYRGRGALQTTGLSNYQQLSSHLGKPEIMDNPDLVASKYAFESALFFFEKNGLWSICDKGISDSIITQVTKKVNGGTNGLAERIALTKKYYSWLK